MIKGPWLLTWRQFLAAAAFGMVLGIAAVMTAFVFTSKPICCPCQ